MKFIKFKLISLIYFLEKCIDVISLFLINNLKEKYGMVYLIFSIKIFFTFLFKFIYYFLYVLLLFLMSIKYIWLKDKKYFIYFKRLIILFFFWIIFGYLLTFKYIAYLCLFIYLFIIIKNIYKQKPKSILDLFLICNKYITSFYLKIKHKVISMIKLL